MIKKILTIFSSFLGMLILTALPVFAHVVVKPSTAGIGAFTDFTIGVPSEKPVATTAVRLFLPTGLENISPIVKPGWTIEVKQSPDPSGKKDDDGNLAMITSEIDWTGGQIPSGQKDLFQFSAQVPTKETVLPWKVEQTYADGSVVSWNLGPKDQQPKDASGNPDFSKFGPYSMTRVVNDLKASPEDSTISDLGSRVKVTMLLSMSALALSIVGIVLAQRKKQ